jgi:hypothetical protein
MRPEVKRAVATFSCHPTVNMASQQASEASQVSQRALDSISFGGVMSQHRPRRDSRAINQENRPTKHSKKRKEPDYQPPHKLVVPTVALTMALTTANALAQDKEMLTAPPIEVREQRPGYIVPNLGLSRLPEPTRDIPQTINVVPQELMQEQGVSNLQDALRIRSSCYASWTWSAGCAGTSSTPISKTASLAINSRAQITCGVIAVA